MGKYIMALDQGTTSSRCILFDRQGRICASANKEYNQYYPKPGWVEHDPIEIWSSQASVALEAMNRIGASAGDIQGIGITNQRETTIVWNRHSGQPIHRAIVWQCRRTAPMIDQLLADGMGEEIREKTGLIPDAYFSGTKLRWILDHVPGAMEAAERGDLLFGTVESWLIWQLTGGRVHVTDYTNASRTMLFNIHTMDWDDGILSYLKIPKGMLPRVAGSSEIYGYTSEKLTGVPVPIAGAAGDQQAALFGQCCFEPGDVKNTYGTGCFLLMNTGGRAVHSENGLLTTIAVNADGTPCYALEGSVFVAGAAIQWLRDELQLISNAAESEFHCREVRDTNGVYLVPAFTGLGAPYWDQYARGAIVGLTRGVNRSHLIRAAVESLAYQVSGLIRAMEKDSGISLTSLKVDGGASANNFLMQFQADLLGRSVVRPACIETTAMGAAYLAGISTGFWNDIGEIRRIWQREKTFSPVMEEAERQKKLRGWEKAVRCTFEWAKDE